VRPLTAVDAHADVVVLWAPRRRLVGAASASRPRPVGAASAKDLLRRQDAADERVKVAAATTGVALLEVHSRVSLPGSDLAKAVLGVAESSASGGAVLGALVPQNPLSGKVSDAAAAIQSGRAQADLFACEADFAASCPDGWSQSGAACVAPAVYAGPCERRREFASGDVAAKASFADSCDAPWPCKGGSDACPQLPQGLVTRSLRLL
jgi:CPW-WPC domain-containing protein